MGIRAKFFVVLAVIAALIGGTTYNVLNKSHDQLIEMEAGRIADIVSTQVLADRAIYSKSLVGKLKGEGTGAARDASEREGFIMLPAQFVRAVSQHVADSADPLYSYRLVSEWNLNEDQGLATGFDRWAWDQLVQQEAEFKQGAGASGGNHPWKSVSRIETVNGQPMLKYLRADPASVESCVSCHNACEKKTDVIALRKSQGVDPGKQWQLGELMGAVAVNIPLAGVQAAAADARNTLFMSLGGVLAIGLVILLGALYWTVIKPTERSISSVDGFKECVDEVVKCAAQLLEGAEGQLDVIAESGDKLETERVQNLAEKNASNAELAAASCGELEDRFEALNQEMQKMIGRS